MKVYAIQMSAPFPYTNSPSELVMLREELGLDFWNLSLLARKGVSY